MHAHACTNTHTYTHTRAHTRTHAHTHTHTHTHTKKNKTIYKFFCFIKLHDATKLVDGSEINKVNTTQMNRLEKGCQVNRKHTLQHCIGYYL